MNVWMSSHKQTMTEKKETTEEDRWSLDQSMKVAAIKGRQVSMSSHWIPEWRLQGGGYDQDYDQDGTNNTGGVDELEGTSRAETKRQRRRAREFPDSWDRWSEEKPSSTAGDWVEALNRWQRYTKKSALRNHWGVVRSVLYRPCSMGCINECRPDIVDNNALRFDEGYTHTDSSHPHPYCSSTSYCLPCLALPFFVSAPR